MKLPVLKFEQSGKVLFLGKMTARQILDKCVTTEWDPAIGWQDLQAQGYQREPWKEHYEAIGHFLKQSNDPFMPTAALLSARKGDYGLLSFRPTGVAGDLEFGELEIHDAWQLFIIDYQHRWRGLRYALEELGAAHLEDFAVPVIIIEDVSRYEEIVQFYVINSKQRRIDTDLALALLQTLAHQANEQELLNLVGPGKRFRIRATRLTFKLASRQAGPWVGRIAQPHDLPQPEAVIKLKSFVDSLAPLVSKRSSCANLDDDPLLDTLVDFWEGVREIMPNTFQTPRDYQIQRTVGVFALHLLFAREVYPRCMLAGDTSPATVKRIIGPAVGKYLNDAFWSTKGPASIYVGSSGYRELARLITLEL